MPKITAITAQRNKDRVNLFVDDEFLMGLDAVAALGARLKVGQEVDTEQLQEVVMQSEVRSAFNKAGNKLGSRAHSVNEIKRYLYDKGYERNIIERAIDRLQEYGMLDDAAFARQVVSSYSHKNSKRVIRGRLHDAGVSAEVIDEVMDYDDQSISGVLEKYLRSHDFNKDKVIGYLMRKGYSYTDVKQAISDYQQACESDE